MYVAVKGGEAAVANSRKLVKRSRRGPLHIPKIGTDQVDHQLGLAVDRVMAEGALYDRKAAAQAILQSQGDMVEAIFLLRAFRTTLKRFGNSKPVNTGKMQVIRRVSGAFKDIPGGQILGPTYDYTHRLIEFEDEPEPPSRGIQPSREAQIDSDSTSPDQELAGLAPRFQQLPWVVDILRNQGLMPPASETLIGEAVEDLTREPLKVPASRSIRLQNLARGDEGFLLGTAYSLQRGFGLDRHPFLGELRVGYVELTYTPPELGFEISIGRVKVTECFMINRNDGSENRSPGFENGYGLVFGQNERKAMSMSLLDRSLQSAEEGVEVKYPAQDQEFVLSHSDNVESSGFVQHLKLPHYVDFQSELVFIRNYTKDSQKKRKVPVESSV
ncbi:MAG: carbon-phosphorus lyase complex subunit PhnI [Desulfobacteraceae bacterium]|nr:MAG: carbon-phosphorus lyase complex subunit PhnI [Desulfobacteraceae bacterium]